MLAVVTGASSGIGAALAAGLARRGHDLLLVARSADALHEHADRLATRYGVGAEVRAVDLTEPAQRAGLADELAGRGADVLCANAGTAGFGPFTDLDNLAHVELNVTATVALIGAALPGMIANRRGGLLVTGSLAGNQPMPGAATYAAGKAFAAVLGEALHTELRGTGVACTVLTPGPVRTRFYAGAGMEHVAQKIPDAFWVSPERAAEAGLRALERNRRRVTPGTVPRLLAAGGRLAPHPAVLRVVNGLIKRYV